MWVPNHLPKECQDLSRSDSSPCWVWRPSQLDKQFNILAKSSRFAERITSIEGENEWSSTQQAVEPSRQRNRSTKIRIRFERWTKKPILKPILIGSCKRKKRLKKLTNLALAILAVCITCSRQFCMLDRWPASAWCEECRCVGKAS